jgi:shikimate kinase
MKELFEIALPKTVVLIGMMGVGKTSIGRRLAKKLGVEFIDSDHEVELAAKCSVADIFEIYGEDAFRDVEKRVIKRLLSEKPHVLATGGGAFTDEESCTIIQENGISVWLKADPSTLLPRLERRDHRPQFHQGDIEKELTDLLEKYTPHYSKAVIQVDCTGSSPEATTDKIMLELNRYLSKIQMSSGQKINHV